MSYNLTSCDATSLVLLSWEVVSVDVVYFTVILGFGFFGLKRSWIYISIGSVFKSLAYHYGDRKIRQILGGVFILLPF